MGPNNTYKCDLINSLVPMIMLSLNHQNHKQWPSWGHVPYIEDLTEEDDEEIHLEDPPEAGDAPTEAGDAPVEAAQAGHGGSPGPGAVPPPPLPPQPET